MKRRAVSLLTAALALPGAAIAQSVAPSWPIKPVRVVVPFPPGGAMDVIARTLGNRAAPELGQPFVIENRRGAGGNVSADYVAKQPADGYTITIISIGMATNKTLVNDTEYGLSMAVLSRDVERALKLGEFLRIGLLHINDQTVNDEVISPFGAVGASGNGSSIGGAANWDEFTQWQWLTAKGQAPAFPF